MVTALVYLIFFSERQRDYG